MSDNGFSRTIPLSKTTKFIVDNRGKTAPTAETGIALIATNCISNEHLYPQYLNVRRVSQETYATWFRAHPEPGDIILTNKGSQNGAICLVPDPVDFVIAQDMVALRADKGVIDPLFLFAALRSPTAQLQIKNLDVSGVIPHFKKTDFDKLHLPYPDMAAQRAIGRIYFEFSAKIELNRRMNETLEGMARAIFKSWFVDFDPVRAKLDGRHPPGLDAETAALFPDRFEHAEMGLLPRGWKPGSIAELASYVNGRNFTKNATGTGRMVIRIAESNSGPGASTKYNDVDAAPENVASPDDILFAWSGSLGVYRWHRDEALVNQHIFKVICGDYPKWFVYSWLVEAMPFFREIAAHKATTMGHIQRGHLSEAPVAIPPTNVLRAATEVVEPAFSLIHKNERQSQTLSTIRDALLPKLLSGKIRVGEAERIVGRAV